MVLLKRLAKHSIYSIKFLFEKMLIKIVGLCGYNLSKKEDFYSPMTGKESLLAEVKRWDKPSLMRGILLDEMKIKSRFAELSTLYAMEFMKLPSYEDHKNLGYGHGYTATDALTSYFIIRDVKPKQMIEVGSGLSTYYSHLAIEKNKEEGTDCLLTCIEPYPYPKLSSIPGINLVVDEVQNVALQKFEQLNSGDILFIDSSHILRIDGDVPFLFLEVLPSLKKGVHVHIHDVHFPYNTPYPSSEWVFNKRLNFPCLWNEAMLLQAFLTYNDSFEVQMSLPYLRHLDEQFLVNVIDGYQNVQEEPNTFSSIWLERTN